MPSPRRSRPRLSTLSLAWVLALLPACKAVDTNGDPGAQGGSGGVSSPATGGAPAASGGQGGGPTGAGGQAGGAAGGGGGGGGATSPGNAGTGGAPADASAETAPAPATGGPSHEPPEVPAPPPTDLTKHRFSKAIKMDTTAAGAGVMGNVASFPVAVPLGADTFDFSQAKPNGEDIRLSSADGRLLPYSIELWDPAGKRAVLWVKTDVKGNDNTQSLLLHWGNPDAVSAADSKAVFSLADGFVGVWHLNQDGSTTKDAYRDASENAVHGTGVMLAPGSTAPARVGLGTVLQNSREGYKGQWVRVDDPKAIDGYHAGGAHPITASIWAYANSFPAHSTIGKYETPMSKGDMAWTIQRDYQSRWEACTEIGYHACAFGPSPMAKRWYHLVMVQNKTRILLYVDGRQTGSAPSRGTPSTHPLGIGQQTQKIQKREWDGVLDEARVMSVERSADWIKLDFESQKEGAKFLSFGPTQNK